MDYASTSPENQDLAKALDDRIGELSAVAHATLAQVAKASAEFDAIGGWGAGGIRSFPHWLTVKTGIDMHTGGELLRVGQAMRLLPRIAAAFEAGQLSFDKMRQITTVATPATEAFLLEIAQGASGAQLARICRSLRRIAEAEAPEQADEHRSRRGLWMHWDEHGMLELKATLTPEDAAVVQAALESITGSRPVPEPADDGVKDPADDRWAARKVDALVAMCEHVIAGGAENLVTSTAARQVVVHVDVGVLTGEAEAGRCYVEGGSPLSAGAARRIGCDAEVIGVVERNARSTSVASSEWCRTGCAWRSMCEIASAAFPAAACRLTAPRPITTSTGHSAERPTSTTYCCCADFIIDVITRAHIASARRLMATHSRPMMGMRSSRRLARR